MKSGFGVPGKLAIVVSVATLVFFAVGLSGAYSAIYRMINENAGADQKKMASLIAYGVSSAVNESARAVLARSGNAGAALVGSGAVAAGEVTQNEATGVWSVPFNVSPDSPGKSQYSELVDVGALSGPVKSFTMGNTGSAIIVDEKAYLVYMKGITPFTNKFCSYNDLQQLLNNPAGYAVMSGVYGYKGKVFASCAFIDDPILVKGGIRWWVFVVRSADDVFYPLSVLTKRVSIAAIILLLLAAVTGIVMGRVFVRPVFLLKEGIDRLGNGDLEYRVKEETKDEIGRLAHAFNEMMEHVSKTTTSVSKLDREVAARKNAEEKARKLAEEWQSAFDSIKGSMAGSGARTGDKKAMDKVDELVQATKLESGKIVISKSSVDMRDIVRKSVLMYEPKIRDKGLDFRLESPREKVAVEADPEKISQVLRILIDNAMKYTQRGQITISLRDAHDAVELSVSDTGCGINKEDLSGIFEGFKHLNLSIAKGIIEKHDGKIRIESEPAKSTKATVIIPKITPAV
jgi:signal transduction histidine kinase